MTDDHTRKAAHTMAALLAPALKEAERQERQLYSSEIEAIEWLREQWKRDPETFINSWVADRYVQNETIDLNGRMSLSMPG